jgi:HYR domain
MLTASAGGILAPERPTLWTDVQTWSTSTTATFNFSGSGSGFICRLDSGAADWAPCTSPVSYSSLGEGNYTFQVRAVDASGDESPPATFEWTIDVTAPSLPGDVVVEATAPSGAVVVLAGLDNLDASPRLDCAPASASTFPLGTTTVSCTATDAAGNTTPGTLTVTVRDTTPPTLAPHLDVIAAQQSQQGAVVQYALPVADDAADPSPAVACNPPAGSTFPLGITTVTCSATDAAGLTSSPIGFDVIVQAGAKPATPAIVADVPRLTNRSGASFQLTVESDASVECSLDGPLGSGSFTPCSGNTTQAYSGLVDGSYLFTVQVTNSIGNRSQASYAWTVDLTAPAPLAGLAVRARNRLVTLSWAKPADADYNRVRIWRRRAGSTVWKRLADRFSATAFTDRTVTNHVLYRYRLATLDAAGNVATPVEVSARPSPVFSPAAGAVVHRPPLVDWMSVRRATYYNMQVWRNGRKILSVWPFESRYQLRSSWTFRGKRYSLHEGRVTVWVWPGFGPKAAARYGGVLGWTTFRIG